MTNEVLNITRPLFRYLITQNIDVDAQDNQGWTPLMCLAANRGTMDIAHALIRSGIIVP